MILCRTIPLYYESLCFNCGEYQIAVSVNASCHLYCDRLSQPLFLGQLVRYFSESNSDSTITLEEAYLYAAGVILCSGLNIFAIHPYMMGIIHVGMKMRVACCSLIYRKVCEISDALFFSGVVLTLMMHCVGQRDTRWCNWLRHCVTSQKVTGSIPDGVTRIFH